MSSDLRRRDAAKVDALLGVDGVVAVRAETRFVADPFVADRALDPAARRAGTAFAADAGLLGHVVAANFPGAAVRQRVAAKPFRLLRLRLGEVVACQRFACHCIDDRRALVMKKSHGVSLWLKS